MDVRILGPLEVSADDGPLRLGGGKERTLLAVLVVHAGEVVSADRLIAALWDDELPANAANALQLHISRLRKTLEPERARGAAARVVVTKHPGYALEVGSERVDARRFETLLARGRENLELGRPADAEELLGEALALWRGPALADFAYASFAQNEIARLEELHLVAQEEHAEARLALGQHADLVGELEQLLDAHPLRERPRGQLMRALYLSGRQADALGVYQQTRRLLNDELGIEPRPELRALERAILQQDPALDAPTEQAPRPPEQAGADGDGLWAAPGPVLLSTKLQIPVLRDEIVARPQLLARLDECIDRRLTLLAAPAGSGKTTLLSSWCRREAPGRSFAWVSLDAGDNDPGRFLTYLIEALRTIDPTIGERALAALRAQGASLTDAVLPLLVNELALLQDTVVIVLDDYHLVTSGEIGEALVFLVEHLPPALHVVLATRSEPSLPLARLRARGELSEIDAAEFRFSPDEATALLNESLGLELAVDDVARLQQRTEGWAAGLYLAALSLRGRRDPASFVEDFAGDDRYIVDYLATEILERQPKALRTFMRRTSILDRLCGPLCDAIMDSHGSARTLAAIERSNLFLVPLDTRREWYRYHQLFGDFLRAELDTTEPELVPTLHRRASRWHRESGSIPDAIQHSTAASDLEEAADLIALYWFRYYSSQGPTTVAAWLDGLPPDLVMRDPRLCLARGWSLTSVGQPAEAERWLEAAEGREHRGPLPDGSRSLESAVGTLRAYVKCLLGDVSGAIKAAEHASALETDRASPGRVRACVMLGMSLFWAGQSSQARTPLEESARAGELNEQELPVMLALSYLAALHYHLGEKERAGELAQRSIGIAEALHAGESPQAAMSHLVLGSLQLDRADLDGAASSLERGLALAPRLGSTMEVGYGLLALAAVRREGGDDDQAATVLRDARRAVEGCADPGMLSELLPSVEQ